MPESGCSPDRQMHQPDPETSLRDIIRVLPFWPAERYLELAPKYWLSTRARFNADELAAEVGTITAPHAHAAA